MVLYLLGKFDFVIEIVNMKSFKRRLNFHYQLFEKLDEMFDLMILNKATMNMLGMVNKKQRTNIIRFVFGFITTHDK